MFRSWLHWLVVDVAGGADPTKGRTLTQYKGPSPPKGVHRCVIAMQRAPLGSSEADSDWFDAFACMCKPLLLAATSSFSSSSPRSWAPSTRSWRRPSATASTCVPAPQQRVFLVALTPPPLALPGARLRGRQQAAGPRGRHLFRGGKVRGAPQGALSACWTTPCTYICTGTRRWRAWECAWLHARARRFAAGRVRVAPGCNAAHAFRVRLVRCEPALARRQQPRVPQTRARRQYSCTAPLPLRPRFASTSQRSAA